VGSSERVQRRHAKITIIGVSSKMRSTLTKTADAVSAEKSGYAGLSSDFPIRTPCGVRYANAGDP
jgi:hypothetical protein